MVIENIMYFALGLLVASLISLIILPAVWKRAVRLTKQRIEAATPITMAEFRADKDQLRAEFALSTRRLELNIETLRRRLAEQLGDANQNRSDLGQLKAEREKHLSIVKELEEREAAQGQRVIALEAQNADLAQRLRMNERDGEERRADLEALRLTLRDNLPPASDISGETLTGEYEPDVERLINAVAAERARARFIEEQAQGLIARLEAAGRRGSDADAQPAEAPAEEDNLLSAQARISGAENQLTALLAASGKLQSDGAAEDEQPLAEKLTLEARVDGLRDKVGSVQSSIVADWGSASIDSTKLREQLSDISTDVSRLVYAAENEVTMEPSLEESLFDRVQRFADESELLDTTPAAPAKSGRRGSVTDRMAAIREIQGR